jgi:hypothetical protein
MEYVPGGDFRTLLNNSGVLKEEHARFYISEMFAAVNELHKLGYIHRDLKPEVRDHLQVDQAVVLTPALKELPCRWDRSRQTYGFRIGHWSTEPKTD